MNDTLSLVLRNKKKNYLPLFKMMSSKSCDGRLLTLLQSVTKMVIQSTFMSQIEELLFLLGRNEAEIHSLSHRLQLRSLWCIFLCKYIFTNYRKYICFVILMLVKIHYSKQMNPARSNRDS